jgi:serine/threonine protein phosphatase PrpC
MHLLILLVDREDEKERIEKIGGRIIHYGTWRVEGVLAVTRAIGDRRLKKYISAVPEIRTRPLQPGDDYLILASDGVWDVLSSQATVDIVNTAKDCREGAQKITDAAYNHHSMDNITSLVIDLRPYR